jgi:hypothetical protein
MVVCVGLVLSACGGDSDVSNGGLVCGPGTHEENGVCVIDQDVGTSTDTGTDTGTDAGTDAGTDTGPEIVEVSDVSQTILLIEACVTVETAEGTDCSEELVVDWGSVVPGDGADGDIELTNTGSSHANLTGITWLSGGEMVDAQFFSASLFNNGQPAGDLPVPIDQNETLWVNVALLPGLAPGTLPVDSVALTVSGDNGDEQSIVVSLVGSVSECSEGSGSCEEDWSNGCETNTTTSQEHCGACDNPCTVVHGTSACETSLCVVTCDDGWDGAVCDTNIDECATQPDLCEVNATCSDTEGGFECVCNAGFEDDGVECADIDECALLTDNCSDNALCTNASSSFSCECNSGYSGDGVTCTNIDECATEADNCGAKAGCTEGDGVTCGNLDECTLEIDDCDANAACIDSEGSFVCTCNPGYEGDGSTCANVNECTLGIAGCDANAACIDSEGSFDCACNPGYEGDGVTCGNLDECTLEIDDCDANAACIDSEGSFVCTCNPGYEGDGVTCANINECALGIAGCDANASCSDNDGSFTCACNPGYEGDGVTCSNLDECTLEIDDCDANATCIDNDGSFTCACNPGYEGDGVTCANINECALGIAGCDANASCSDNDGSFTCACNAGYIGDGLTCALPISCQDILSGGMSAGDGLYTIDIDGTGPSVAFQVYCDMTTNGGGWTNIWGRGDSPILLSSFGLAGFSAFTLDQDTMSIDSNVSCSGIAEGFHMQLQGAPASSEMLWKNLVWTGTGPSNTTTDFCTGIPSTTDGLWIKHNGLNTSFPFQNITVTFDFSPGDLLSATCGCAGGNPQRGFVSSGTMYVR